MSKADLIEAEGVIEEVLPNRTFRVKLKNDYIIVCYPSGKMSQNRITLIEGDCVKVEMSPYDLTKGRITWRIKN